jgi:hypothetical protein
MDPVDKWYEDNLVTAWKDDKGKPIKQLWFTRADVKRVVSKARAEAIKALTPPGYVLVLVPDEKAPDEPDWKEVQRQAEVSYGIKVGDLTMPILIREVRRWIAHQKNLGPPERVEPSWLTNPLPTPSRQFAEWLNSRRGCNVSEIFHQTMQRFASLTKQPAPDAAMPDLQDLHNLLYLAQRQNSLGAMRSAVGAARLELSKVRDGK